MANERLASNAPKKNVHVVNISPAAQKKMVMAESTARDI
jgi:hypothetical protein